MLTFGGNQVEDISGFWYDSYNFSFNLTLCFKNLNKTMVLHDCRTYGIMKSHREEN